MGKRNATLAIALLALGLAGVAFAGVQGGSSPAGGSSQINVAVLEGKLTVSATTLPAGRLTLVVVNKGKLTHGLAIMGTDMSPKRTATIGVGKTARLIVTLKAGKYHLWDPVRSSMSHATFLTVKAASSAKSSGGSYTMTGGSSGGSSSGGGDTMDPGMEGC